MSNIDNLFEKRLNEILKKYDINDNIFLVFKGFSYKEIMYLSSLKNSGSMSIVGVIRKMK